MLKEFVIFKFRNELLFVYGLFIVNKQHSDQSKFAQKIIETIVRHLERVDLTTIAIVSETILRTAAPERGVFEI